MKPKLQLPRILLVHKRSSTRLVRYFNTEDRSKNSNYPKQVRKNSEHLIVIDENIGSMNIQEDFPSLDNVNDVITEMDYPQTELILPITDMFQGFQDLDLRETW